MNIYEKIPEDWENSHGWYYYADTVRYYSANVSKYKTKKGKVFLIKNCIKCNRQWQMRWISTTGVRYYDYYKGLPTYKMDREICSECSPKKNKPTRERGK